MVIMHNATYLMDRILKIEKAHGIIQKFYLAVDKAKKRDPGNVVTINVFNNSKSQ